jgi:hypothetical protein
MHLYVNMFLAIAHNVLERSLSNLRSIGMTIDYIVVMYIRNFFYWCVVCNFYGDVETIV